MKAKVLPLFVVVILAFSVAQPIFATGPGLGIPI